MEYKRMKFEEENREIKQRENYNRTIIETAQDGFWLVDITGKITDVNQAYCQMTGYTKKELLGMTIRELDVFEDHQKSMTHINEIIKNGSDKFETKHRRKDGSLIDIEVSATFTGHDMGIFAFCRDITERIEAEKALKLSEEKYRLITENISDVICVYNLSKNKFTYISPSILTLRGITVEEALRENLEDFIVPEYIEVEKANLLKNSEDFLNNPKTSNNYIHEIQQFCKNGETIWVEISTKYRYNLEKELEVIGISRNIDERKKTEEMLLQSEEKFKMLFEKAPLGYQSLDIDGYLIDINQQWLNMMGYKREEVIGKWFGDFMSQPYQDRFRKRFPLFKAQGHIQSRFEMVHKNGQKISIDLNGKIGYNEDNEFRRSHCILKDITIEQQLVDDLKQSEERYKFLFEYSGLAVGFYKTDGTIIYYNQKAAEFMGGKPEEYTGKSVYDIFTKELADISMNNIMNAAMSEDSKEYINFAKLETGDKWFNTTYKRITNHMGDVIGVQAISLDITKRVEANNALSASEAKYRLITENTSDVISVYNLTKNKFTYISPSILTLRGITVEEALSENLEDSIVPEYIEKAKSNLLKNTEDFLNNPIKGNNYINELQQFCKNGETIWVEISTKYRYNLENELEAIGISRNIDERKKTEAMMINLSYYDQLTKLYNRRFYEEELKRLDTERNLPLTLIMADVNGLKLTNDAFGHQEGDILLQTIAQILKKECRDDEIISRIGGDEFVILIPKCNSMDARHFISRLNAAILKGKKKNPILSISMGYAVKDKVEQKINKIFKKAEDDMYRHKVSEGLSMRSKTIELIMNSLFEKSNREKRHSDRVGTMCVSIASYMNFNQEDIQQIKIAGLLHDIGKIGISDVILSKEGKLNTYEWKEMKKHSEIGYRLLSTIHEFSEISEYVRSHQERWDGKGYPRKLKNKEIPIQARIIAVADAFDAMTVKRSYREELSESEALFEIRKYAGTQFDPEVARIFVEKVMNATW